MAQTHSRPWHPDPSWADLFIATLVLAILLLLGGTLRGRRTRPLPPDAGLTLQGRLQDVVLGATETQQGDLLRRLKLPGLSVVELAKGDGTGWDRAMLAVHAAEIGDLATGDRLIQAAPGADGAAFRDAWQWGYRGAGAPPTPRAQRLVQRQLGAGFAARILEARLLGRGGGDPRPLEAQARTWATTRLLLFGAAGSAGFMLMIVGIAFWLFLVAVPVPPVPLPHMGMSGRALLIVLLGWFLALLAAGPMTSALVRLVPALRPLFLPLDYAFHALLGTAFLCRAEGVDLRTLWRRVAPGRHGAAAATGLGFFTVAFAAVAVVSLALSPWLRNVASPQAQLLDLLSRLQGLWVVGLLFVTVAVLAPAFEELLFRGVLLPWLGERMEPRLGVRRARWTAIALTGLGFGAMHMQPLGLPTLTTLGVVLGFAFLRTGNLGTSILVHGLWNGGVFLLVRGLS